MIRDDVTVNSSTKEWKLLSRKGGIVLRSKLLV
jgi:hypothetical protein